MLLSHKTAAYYCSRYALFCLTASSLNFTRMSGYSSRLHGLAIRVSDVAACNKTSWTGNFVMLVCLQQAHIFALSKP